MNARKTVLLTGATRGIGLACARTLATDGNHDLRLGVRDLACGEAVRADLGERAALVELELTSLACVRAAIATIREGPRLHAIVCNAGLQEVGPPTFTEDGIETTFAVNHVAHQLLVLGLLDHLAPGARVVMVSSGTHDPDTLEGRVSPPAPPVVADLVRGVAAEETLSATCRYTSSKLCNILFALELDRRARAEGRALWVNAYDPGAVPGTGLTRAWSPWLRMLTKGSWILRLFGLDVSTPRRAGRALARLVADPSLDGISGRYYTLDRERAPSRDARDPALAATLFDDTLALVGEQRTSSRL
ncbi:MAG: SDR family NAD(P)-dependent oxidoreductase [Myxococcota bacterium]